MSTALRLKETGKTDMLRAGVWKPRTRPGHFEGVGAIALPWLQEARSATGLPVAIEVATAAQVSLALKHDIDCLWIGARTTVNPFSVQELADVLKGVDIPVLIKNPVNADIELWIGAMERISKAGVGKIGLVHRGFSSYGNTEYRNAPMWHLAIDMKLRYPEVPFLIDPSHIVGNRQGLQAVMQKAIDLDYNGIMIESHAAPDDAWSDAQQQITPERMDQILQAMIWRKYGTETREATELERYRHQIDQLDDEVLQILSSRMKLAEKIGVYKKENDMTILQAARWNEVLARVCHMGERLGLSKEFLVRYCDALHMESIKHQDRVMNQ